MTKYVLNSGGLINDDSKAKKYFAELVKGLGSSPKILLSFFAEKPDTWELKFKSYVPQFATYLPEGVEPTFDMALPYTFEKQVSESDVIYCHGGSVRLALKEYTSHNCIDVWDGKVVGTNSATTAMLANSFWICDERTLGDGMGVWPAKVVVHYNSASYDSDPRGPIDWEKAKQELAEYGDKNLPMYALEEGEFEVFEV